MQEKKDKRASRKRVNIQNRRSSKRGTDTVRRVAGGGDGDAEPAGGRMGGGGVGGDVSGGVTYQATENEAGNVNNNDDQEANDLRVSRDEDWEIRYNLI